MATIGNYFRPVLLLAIGALFGWWLRGSLGLPDAGIVMSRPTSYEDQNSALHETAPDLLHQPDHPQHKVQIDKVRHEPPTSRPQEPHPEPATRSALKRFQTQLDKRQFSAAMDLYRELERLGDPRVPRLKAMVLKHLDTHLNQENDTAFTDLADAYLSSFYDDSDVLLRVAQHQHLSGYLMEAAQTFQLALDYALADSSEQQQTEEAFDAFIARVEHRLTEQSRWSRLTRFYETLHQLGLARPEDRLRQAELYLRQNDVYRARTLLTPLAQDSALASQAQALLAGIRGPSEREKDRSPNQQTLPLEALGQHFHLPLRVNEVAQVKLLIDTGASITTLSTRAFDALRHQTHLTELGPHLFHTAGGPTKGTLYRVDTLDLGKHRLFDVRIAVLEFDMPDGVDGLLGMNVLQRFRFQVNQDAKTLELEPRG